MPVVLLVLVATLGVEADVAVEVDGGNSEGMDVVVPLTPAICTGLS